MRWPRPVLPRAVWVAAAIATHAGGETAGVRAQQPTFSTRIETVRLDVSVRRNGQAVRGLVASDFEVLDNGVPQQLTFVGLEETPASVVLALDMSGSVQGERLVQLRAAGARLVDMLGPDDTAAVVAFTDRVALRSGFTREKPRLISALQAAVVGRDTALRDAVHAALVLGESGAGRPLVIVFSDGTDTASFLTSDVVLDSARRTEPVVYAVTSALEERDRFLDDLVRLTGGRRLEVASLDRLSDAFAEILSESRERYLLSYTPAGVRPDGWHEIVVRVGGPGAEVRARPGYLAGP